MIIILAIVVIAVIAFVVLSKSIPEGEETPGAGFVRKDGTK